MTNPEPQPDQRLPSRTSILVAAGRAFGSREPDETVRNPDMLADRLLGDEELALISDHPLGQALKQDYHEASQNPAVLGLAWMMLLRTRFIDEALERAVKNGATQIVILGAGFDTRAHRFRHLLKHCKVIEVDAAPTQNHKRRRIASVVADNRLHNRRPGRLASSRRSSLNGKDLLHLGGRQHVPSRGERSQNARHHCHAFGPRQFRGHGFRQ
jgi:O-methyltransferase involved in polyketide biosynthesis